MTNAERIISVLRERDRLDDDELSTKAGVSPRQTVNQICRRLESQGMLVRSRRAGGKIINRLSDSATQEHAERPRKLGVNHLRVPAPARSSKPAGRRRPNRHKGI
jgi:DNA-binding GntR family transcriptional regulator